MQVEPEAGMRAIAYTAKGPFLVTIMKVEGTRLIWKESSQFFGNWSIWEWGGNLIPIPEGATEDQVQALLSIIDEP